MDSILIVFILTTFNVLDCRPITWEEKLNLLLKYRRAIDDIIETQPSRRIFNEAEPDQFENTRRHAVSLEDSIEDYQQSFDDIKNSKISRRMSDFHPGMKSTIMGTPTRPSQLPEAEPILPGHTLIRPALGMLKSAVKFPHKDLDNGAGVYGNIDSLGITYGGTGERVLYTGFRRNNDYSNDYKPRYVVAIVRENQRHQDKPIARYVDYHKRELQQKKMRDNLELRQVRKKNGLDNIRDKLFKQDMKKLYKKFSANGLTLEFFEIPRLREEARAIENYHETIKPYTELIEATRERDLSAVENRYPSIVKEYSSNLFTPRENSVNYGSYRAANTRGIKKYVRR